jgi:hypothetical protein
MTSDSVCHSEERRDEESAFDFSVLIERMRKSAKQMLHFIQHDKTANCERPEGFGFPLRLCGNIPILLVAALPRCVLCVNFLLRR